jgi:hypothetical protein
MNAKELLTLIAKYLYKNNWTANSSGQIKDFSYNDPITKHKHTLFTAISIQLERHINSDDSCDILDKMGDYLSDKKWKICNYSFYHVDPVTSARYPTDLAFYIQIQRDFQKGLDKHEPA